MNHQKAVELPTSSTLGRQAPERITVTLLPRVADQLTDLQSSTGLSKTDLVNRAISLYDFTSRQFAAGMEMLLRDPKTGEGQLVHLL
jgi:hypothetical protein